MILNNITLKNFKSYEDETTFSFTPKDDKNIVLIGGENGAGKSTLFEAIKLCIYGPTTFGYLGLNNNYITKIKNSINYNAFKNKDIEAYIGISLTFKDGTSCKNYYLKRIWTYNNQKLSEVFEIYYDNKLLNEEDKVYFDKYLKSVLPPSLFDFFFFDGEELSDFFTGKSANSNLKESILQLFNFDTFETLKKQLLSQRRIKSKSNLKLEELQNNYEELLNDTRKLKSSIATLKQSIESDSTHLENLIIKRSVVEEDFKHSGGLFEGEKAALNAEINKLENIRTENNQKIKDFSNDILPFLLVTDLLEKTKYQIESEESLNSYNVIKNQLTSDIIKEVFNDNNLKNLDTNANKIANDIINKMFDTDSLEKVSNILELSPDQKQSILYKVNNILDNDINYRKDILNKFSDNIHISTQLKILRERLNSTISDDILNGYMESIHNINKEINELQKSIAINKSHLDVQNESLANKEYHLTRAKNEYMSLLQSTNVLDISNDIIVYLENLLDKLTTDKITLIEQEFINIFSILIRKDNYVSGIVIDNNFNSTLYINKQYTSTEILNIVDNIGFDNLVKQYGSKFKNDLFEYYNVDNNECLLSSLRNDLSFTYITLSTKVNINDFSNGEKQIYILSLIWAIIKSSGVEIPFIIDTPYARIDESHRNALTTYYLPNISKQVIILSTNKEIDTELHKVIKPYVCDEYLLIYNTVGRKTEVKKGYFEV